MTTEVIVYRNPMEQAIWSAVMTPTFWTILVSFGFAFIVYSSIVEPRLPIRLRQTTWFPLTFIGVITAAMSWLILS